MNALLNIGNIEQYWKYSQSVIIYESFFVILTKAFENL